jgi:trimeric autotransporter adhesin
MDSKRRHFDWNRAALVLVLALLSVVALQRGGSDSAAAWHASDAGGANAFQSISWAGPATQLVFTTAPQVIENSPGTSGTMTVQEQDGLGNPVVATAAVTVSLTSGSTNVTFSPGSSVTIAAGTTSVSFTLTDTTDTTPETVTAAATGMVSATQSEAFNATGSHTTVTVGSQSGTLSPNGTATYSVTVTNCSGCNTHGYSLSNVSGLPAGTTWSANTACDAISGSSPSYTFTLTVTTTTSTPASTSANALVVTATRWNDTNDCNATGGIYEEADGSGSLAVGPGSAARLVFRVQPSGATSSGGVFPIQPSVAILDAYGNVVTSAAASVTLTVSGSGTLGGCTSAVNTSSGVASFTGCKVTGTVDIVNDSLLATATGGYSGSGYSNPFDITGAASKLAFSTQPTGDSGTGQLAQQPVVVVEDSSGHVVTASSASIALSPSADTLACKTSPTTVAAAYGSATFGSCAITTAGSGFTLSAASSGLTSATSSTFSVTISAPTVTAPSSSSPETLAKTETLTFTVTGTNLAYGSAVTDSGGHFTVAGWSWTSATQLSVTVVCLSDGTDGLVVTNPDGGTVTASSALTATA